MKSARCVALLAITVSLGWATRARAADPIAAEAYDRGAEAYDAGDFSRAVTELARADSLAPDAVTLELALKAAARADDAARAMDLAERADARPVPKSVKALGAQARARFAARAGKLVVRCAPPCDVRLDETKIEGGTPVWASAGRHTVSFDRGAGVVRVVTSVVAEGIAEVIAPPLAVAPTAPPPAERAMKSEKKDQAAQRSGPSTVWFWVAAGATAATGAIAGLSAADTATKHAAFARDRSDAGAASAGSSAQTRTNVLFAVTGAAALSTLALGVFVVQW